MKMIDGKLHRYAYLLVYGCQMNQSDAERMMGQLRTIGYERTESCLLYTSPSPRDS